MEQDINASHLFRYVAELEVLRKQYNTSVVRFQGETYEEKVRLLQKLANIYTGYQFTFTANDSAFVYRRKVA